MLHNDFGYLYVTARSTKSHSRYGHFNSKSELCVKRLEVKKKTIFRLCKGKKLQN